MITRTIKYTASDGTEHDSPQTAATFDLAQTILQIGGTFTPMHETMAEKLALSPEALRDALDAYFEDLKAHPDVKPTMVLADYDRFVEIPREEFERWTKPERLRATDNRICATCDGGPGNDGVCLCGEERWVEPDPKADHKLVLTEKAKELTPNLAYPTIKDWTDQGWTRDELLAQGMAVELEEGEIAPGVRGFEMEVPAGAQLPTYDEGDIESVAVYQDGTFTTDLSGTFHLNGDPDDPSTWEVEPRRPVVDRLKASYYEALRESLSRDLPVDHPQYCRPFGTREN